MAGFRPRFFVEPQGGDVASSDGVPSGDGASTGVEVALSADDSYHALRVLRLKAGDACEVVMDGAVYEASVHSSGKRVKVVLGERLHGAQAGAEYGSRVGLVQALTRPALLDYVLEKGTEVGASFFVLVPASGSPHLPKGSQVSRLERWKRIVLEAAKQSKQSAVPSVELADSFVTAQAAAGLREAWSLVLEPSAPRSLRERLERKTVAGAASIALWVGPESGWTDSEVRDLTDAGMEAARLGQSVLRAETAGPVAVAVTRLVLGDW